MNTDTLIKVVAMIDAMIVKEVGIILDDDYKIFATVLYDDYKGKGLGKGMYRYIIKDLSKENKSLYSDDMQSADAARVWDSLVSMGMAEKTGETYKSKV